jgi:hypothetical protein
MVKKSLADMLGTLRGLLREALVLKSAGVPHARLTRANGAVDGYMRALLDAGLAEQSELLALVAEERTALGGPATGSPPSDPQILAA